MPVDTPHPTFEARSGQWELLRDVLGGADCVRAKGFQYLRRPAALKGFDLSEYVRSATFFGATARTLDGLTGAVFRRDPKIEVPEPFTPLLESISPQGRPFVPLAKSIVREVIALGRHGVLVDVNEDGRPHLVSYTAESIINWREQVVNGTSRLVLLVLRENHARPDPDDRYQLKSEEQYRVLELARTGDSEKLSYVVSLFRRKDEARAGFELVEGPNTPLRRGEPLGSIPFIFFGPTTLDPAIENSPILPLADLNLSHYNTSASLEHAVWWTGLPLYTISGRLQEQKGDELLVGPNVIWTLEENAKAEILEYKGTGLGAMEQRLERKERHLAVLGARLLEDQKSGVEAAETVSLRHRGENSLLASIADTVSRGLSKALSLAAWWNGAQPDAATVELNSDFFESPMTAEALLKMAAAWQQGAIGAEVLFHNLKKGERLPDGMSFDDWQADITDNGPDLGFISEATDQ